MKTRSIFFIASIFLIMQSCGSGKKPYPVASEPAQVLVNELSTEEYSIVLNDMDITEDDDNIYYKHKYVILKPKEDKIEVDSTEWLNVGEEFFMSNEKNLGMEIASRHDGRFSGIPKPVGFDWAVGNEKYGEWKIDTTSTEKTVQVKKWHYHNGSRFFLMYWMFSRRTPFSTYNDYASTARNRKAYYGYGNNTYGTNSSYNKVKRAGFYSRKAKNTSWNKTYKTRSSSRSSRYSGSSGARGRSGGHGK